MCTKIITTFYLGQTIHPIIIYLSSQSQNISVINFTCTLDHSRHSFTYYHALTKQRTDSYVVEQFTNKVHNGRDAKYFPNELKLLYVFLVHHVSNKIVLRKHANRYTRNSSAAIPQKDLGKHKTSQTKHSIRQALFIRDAHMNIYFVQTQGITSSLNTSVRRSKVYNQAQNILPK